METPSEKLKFSFLFNSSTDKQYNINQTNTKFNISPWSLCNRLKSSYKKDYYENICNTNIIVPNTNEKTKTFLSSEVGLNKRTPSRRRLHQLDMKTSKFKINNINFDINFSYTTSGGSTEHKDRDVRVNLMKDLASIPQLTEENFITILSEKKKKILSLKEKPQVESDSDLEAKVDYILNTENKIKKDKHSTSCKCRRTNCSKYSCNCLKHGTTCGKFCTCDNCVNKKKI